MKEAVASAMKVLAEQVKPNMKSEDALRYTQSALNLAHVLSVTEDTKNRRK